ncbi:hypothetical protein QR680_014743 [Steinernema hermaphroditum]|uniref:C-type lectin domain-containing protein n=1 Tax=Steinernema hermaphroditum TaxID=289476 RepID=A0AA39IA04_9BILA|nr:hypothetical protein QR680_014743 [Steinernema hermaphroditum]
MWALRTAVVLSFLFLCLEGAPSSLKGLNVTEFVFGGNQARVGQFPMQVYINYKGAKDGQNYHCGGTLISTKHVLTAAHCTTNMGSYKKIMVGSTNRRDFSANAQWRDITKIHRHPDYKEDDENTRYDIAVLEINQPVTLNNNVKLSKIARDDDQLLEAKTAVVSGFGTYAFQGDRLLLSENLLYAEVDLFSFAFCNQAWWDTLIDNQVCAGAAGRGAGQGDSGGPLLVSHNDEDYQIGVFSFLPWSKDEQENHQDKQPGVFTRVASFCDFIEDAANGEFECERLEQPTTTTTTTTAKPTTAEPPVKTHNFGNYILSTTELSFQDAKDFCESIGAKMLTLHKKGTEKIIQRIFNQLKPDDAHIFWLGLYKPEGIRSQYAWLDGSALNYRNWAKGLPIPTPSEECAAHWKPNWVGMDCNWKYSFVCQRK